MENPETGPALTEVELFIMSPELPGISLGISPPELARVSATANCRLETGNSRHRRVRPIRSASQDSGFFRGATPNLTRGFAELSLGVH
jgi:hypothetical protein